MILSEPALHLADLAVLADRWGATVLPLRAFNCGGLERVLAHLGTPSKEPRTKATTDLKISLSDHPQVENGHGETASDNSLIQKLLAFRYEVLMPVDRGASGQVWLVRDKKDKVHLIVKLMPYSNQIRELFGLGRVLSLSHPGLIEILAHEKSKDGAYFWYFMPAADDVTSGELIFDGTYIPCTLANYLRTRKRLPASECLDIVLELCAVVAYLHQQGYIHRDIKPANIMRVGGKWELADIGLLAPIGSESVVGTPGYMPSEGYRIPSRDIYSLDIVLYQILTGSLRPRKPVPPTSTKPDNSIERLLLQVAIKATQRVNSGYESAEHMARDLEEIQRLL